MLNLAHYAILTAPAWSGYAIGASFIWWLPRQIGYAHLTTFLAWAPHSAFSIPPIAGDMTIKLGIGDTQPVAKERSPAHS